MLQEPFIKIFIVTVLKPMQLNTQVQIQV